MSCRPSIMPNTDFRHDPVLCEEAMELLRPSLGPGKIAVDCTLGGGGHTRRLLETGARVIAVDRDETALSAARESLVDERLTLVHGDFRDLSAIVQDFVGGTVDAVLADLGVSSPQLDEPSRGFSFREAGPLDMRMDASRGVPLSERLDKVEETELASIIRELGEERHARRIAKAISRAREEGILTDTSRLAEIIAGAAGRPKKRGKSVIHPATRTFQALRIWVNEELDSLDELLDALPEVLAPGGRVAIISFHSLEDRRVKRAFASLCEPCVCPPDFPVCTCGRRPLFSRLTRKVVRPSAAEAEHNPRARSARLRAVKRSSDVERAVNDDKELPPPSRHQRPPSARTLEDDHDA